LRKAVPLTGPPNARAEWLRAVTLLFIDGLNDDPSRSLARIEDRIGRTAARLETAGSRSRGLIPRSSFFSISRPILRSPRGFPQVAPRARVPISRYRDMIDARDSATRDPRNAALHTARLMSGFVRLHFKSEGWVWTSRTIVEAHRACLGGPTFSRRTAALGPEFLLDYYTSKKR